MCTLQATGKFFFILQDLARERITCKGIEWTQNLARERLFVAGNCRWNAFPLQEFQFALQCFVFRTRILLQGSVSCLTFCPNCTSSFWFFSFLWFGQLHQPCGKRNWLYGPCLIFPRERLFVQTFFFVFRWCSGRIQSLDCLPVCFLKSFYSEKNLSSDKQSLNYWESLSIGLSAPKTEIVGKKKLALMNLVKNLSSWKLPDT